MRAFVELEPGDPAPWFMQRSYANLQYEFSSAAGRYIVMCFFDSAADPHSRVALHTVFSRGHLFDDKRASFFGVSLDPRDESEGRVSDRYPGYRFFFDFDGKISRLYGALPRDIEPGDGQVPVRRLWFVLDPALRIMRRIPFADDQSDISEVRTYLEGLPPPERSMGFEVQAPVLVLPRVFEPDLCRKLISLYESHGGEASDFMREVGGKTTKVRDFLHKSRKDHLIADRNVIEETQSRVRRRVIPQVLKAYQFKVTRMERYIVACYAAEDEAHFAPHRDNMTKGTAHRRFAVSVILNDDYEGGELIFPEYGPRGFRVPAGSAVVFSCSLLHAVSKVTRGRRYAFLPFLYDEEASRIREANNAFLGDGVGRYRARPLIG